MSDTNQNKKQKRKPLNVVSFISGEQDAEQENGSVSTISAGVIFSLKGNNVKIGAVGTLWWIMNQAVILKTNEDPLIYVVPDQVAKDLNISKRSVMSHLKLLKDKRYIFQLNNRQHVYKLNSDFLYKGTVTQQKNS